MSSEEMHGRAVNDATDLLAKERTNFGAQTVGRTGGCVRDKVGKKTLRLRHMKAAGNLADALGSTNVGPQPVRPAFPGLSLIPDSVLRAC